MKFLENFDNIHSRKQIAIIAGVSERTVQRWLSGKSKPRKAYLKLLQLHDKGRVMPQEWAKRFHFNNSGFLDSGHDKALSWQQVDWYFYSLTMWHRTLDMLPRLEARIDALMKVCPPAEVIDLQKYKDEITRIKNRPFVLPESPAKTYDLPAKTLSRANGC